MKIGSLAILIAAAAVVAGCAGGSPQVPPSRGAILPSGIDARFGGLLRTAARQPARIVANHHKRTVESELFVSNGASEIVVLKNGTYQMVGSITTGLNGADGVWTDKKGNVYVANYSGANVTEYKRGQGSPICTYSSGLSDPINVTTDSAGNVYVADFNFKKNPGYIDVYPQCSNTMSKQYDITQGPEGIAVDASGDIFVSYFGPTGSGNFEEIVGGVPTVLAATVNSPAGLVVDSSGNLIADDQRGYIDVIAPPYTSAKVLVSGLSDPFHVSLNAKENLLFNANSGSATVTVYSYPSGTLQTTLGSSYGISAAEGVSDSPNAAF